MIHAHAWLSFEMGLVQQIKYIKINKQSRISYSVHFTNLFGSSILRLAGILRFSF